MAHPADFAPKALAAGRPFSPEEADRLASTFRPSWELDDAPFTGAGNLSDGDLRALQGGGGTHADVRAVAHASNGAHAPPAPTQSHEPENSVIIDRTITADAPSPKPAAAKAAGVTMLGMAPPIVPQAILQVAPQPAPQAPPAAAPHLARPPTPVSQRPAAPAFNVPPPVVKAARAKPVSVDLEESYPKKSRTGLWVGLGLGGVAAIGLVVWMVTSSGSSEKAAQPAPTATRAADDKLSAVPPPPPPTTAAAAATTADTPPPATTAAPTAPPPTATATPIPTTPVAALPQAAPTRAATFQPRPSYGGSAPAARPAGKPKGGQTIVRDVPF